LLILQAAKPKVQFLLLAALNEALTSLAAPGANPSSLSDEQRDQVPCCCPAAGPADTPQISETNELSPRGRHFLIRDGALAP
jgi:hypothetical protein